MLDLMKRYGNPDALLLLHDTNEGVRAYRGGRIVGPGPVASESAAAGAAVQRRGVRRRRAARGGVRRKRQNVKTSKCRNVKMSKAES